VGGFAVNTLATVWQPPVLQLGLPSTAALWAASEWPGACAARRSETPLATSVESLPLSEFTNQAALRSKYQRTEAAIPLVALALVLAAALVHAAWNLTVPEGGSARHPGDSRAAGGVWFCCQRPLRHRPGRYCP
jgi:hypothetical protein